MIAIRLRRACFAALVAVTGLPAAAQSPQPGLPRIIDGTPSPVPAPLPAAPLIVTRPTQSPEPRLPQVIYGTPSPAPAPRPAPPPIATAPAQPPQGRLTYRAGPAYVTPRGHDGPSLGWDEPRWPPQRQRYVFNERRRIESPLADGRYVLRGPSVLPERSRPWAAPQRPVYGRPSGR